jgi:multiple sugar transport system ATP-binding protein
MAKVVFKNVYKIYDDVEAVRDVNLDIKDKEFMILVGPSGCGKSTTLRMIAGLEEISKGDLYIDDIRVNDLEPKKRDIAMVFQNYALYPHMSVAENMAFGLKLRKFPKDEIKKRVENAAEILGLSPYLDRKPKALSGGQRQRVAVGRCIVRQPKVFLFDEPLSNLDAKLRVQMRSELSKLHNKLKTTMVYVTHDQVEAMTMGDRITVMKDGVVHQVDTPLNLYNYPVNKFVAGFIGSPAMNFFSCKVIEQDGVYYFDEGTTKIKVPEEAKNLLKEKGYLGKRIFLGVRPENIYDKLFYPDADESHCIKAIVEVVEPMGTEIFCYASTKFNNITAKFTNEAKPEVNNEIELVLDMKKIHLFDGKTEEVIS